MKVYLVGGAVRDKLLGLPQKEKDWVVVGSTVSEMLSKGFHQVGKDFPVFLHPETKEEYALARQERKIASGYKGFDFNTEPTVTLEDDLKRRDLTINAIAETCEGKIIDPYGGVKDLNKKILRHVSNAFIEDPVRVLRVARFAARFAYLDFKVAPETLILIQQMVKSGEIDALVPERVWKELEKAYSEKNPEDFFKVLAAGNALPKLFPHINTDLIDLLAEASKKTKDPVIRFAVTCNTLSVDAVKTFCKNFRIPTYYKDIAILVAQYKKQYANARNLTPETIIDLLMTTDAFRREERFQKFLDASEIITKQSNSSFLLKALQTAKQVNVREIINQTSLVQKALADKIREERIASLTSLLR